MDSEFRPAAPDRALRSVAEFPGKVGAAWNRPLVPLWSGREALCVFDEGALWAHNMCDQFLWSLRMNITLSVDEQVAQRARKAAQNMGKSLNQAVRDYLEQLGGGGEQWRAVGAIRGTLSAVQCKIEWLDFQPR